MYELFHMRHYFSDNLRDLNILHFVQTFALGLISIFVPIFLYEQGFSLVLIALYIVSHNLFAILFSYGAFFAIHQFGLKRLFIISMILQITFVYFLKIIANNNLLMYGTLIALSIGCLRGLADSAYWMPYHVEFTRSTTKNKTTKQLSTIMIVQQIAQILTPLIGGLSIFTQGYSTTFIVVSILLALGVLPMLFSSDKHEPFSMKGKQLFEKKTEKFQLSYLSYGIMSTSFGVIWPLLFFTIIQNTSYIGGAYSLSNLLIAGITYLTGHFITQHNKRFFSWAGTLFFGLSGVGRAITTNIGSIITLQSIGGLSTPLFSIPHHQTFYEKTRKEKTAAHLFLREFYINIGRAITALLLIFLVQLLPLHIALSTVLIVGAIAIQGLNIMIPKSHK